MLLFNDFLTRPRRKSEDCQGQGGGGGGWVGGLPSQADVQRMQRRVKSDEFG